MYKSRLYAQINVCTGRVDVVLFIKFMLVSIFLQVFEIIYVCNVHYMYIAA